MFIILYCCSLLLAFLDNDLKNFSNLSIFDYPVDISDPNFLKIDWIIFNENIILSLIFFSSFTSKFHKYGNGWFTLKSPNNSIFEIILF